MYLLLCDELRRTGQLARAEKVSEDVRRLAPDHWEVYYYAALIALDKGEYDRAEALAAKSLEIRHSMQAMAIFSMVRDRRATTQEVKQKE